LVVTVTKGFRHDSIPVAEETIRQIGDESGAFTVDYARTDEELSVKTAPAALKNYDGVFFANTTGDLPLADRDAFVKWVADGHAFVGVHAASDTFHGFRPYLEMVGGEFKTHGPQVEVECRVEDPKHPAGKAFEGAPSFKVFDEIYQFQNFDRSRVHGLLTLDAHPNDKTPGDYPVAWCRREGKGRVFYTSLGHRQEVWKAPWYRRHLLGGIKWALGLEKGDDKPQQKKAAEPKERATPAANTH
jgi:type 1 glutamine amidotransferase